MRLDTDGRVFMADDNPDKIYSTNLNEFAKDDNLAIVVVPKNGDVFTPQTLGAIDELTEDLWNYPTFGLSIRSQGSKTPMRTGI